MWSGISIAAFQSVLVCQHSRVCKVWDVRGVPKMQLVSCFTRILPYQHCMAAFLTLLIKTETQHHPPLLSRQPESLRKYFRQDDCWHFSFLCWKVNIKELWESISKIAKFHYDKNDFFGQINSIFNRSNFPIHLIFNWVQFSFFVELLFRKCLNFLQQTKNVVSEQSQKTTLGGKMR